MIDCTFRLGKTIQTLARIIDGRPRKKDKDDGYDASTLYVLFGCVRDH